jgi:hypothetical protein
MVNRQGDLVKNGKIPKRKLVNAKIVLFLGIM